MIFYGDNDAGPVSNKVMDVLENEFGRFFGGVVQFSTSDLVWMDGELASLFDRNLTAYQALMEENGEEITKQLIFDKKGNLVQRSVLPKPQWVSVSEWDRGNVSIGDLTEVE